MSGEIYTIKEVAALLKTSDRTVKREIKAGKLRVFRVGSSLRCTAEALEQYKHLQELRDAAKSLTSSM